MRSSFVALALVLTGHIVCATPITSAVRAVAASFPVLELSPSSGHPESNTTLPHGGIRVNVGQTEFPASLLLCEAVNCAHCGTINLAGLAQNQCLNPGFQFFSASINQPSNEGLPFVVGLGPPGCSSLARLPAVNTCYNLNGAIFENLEILP